MRLILVFGALLLFVSPSVKGYEIGTIRVIGSTNSEPRGRLEMFLEKIEWTPFCITGFDFKAANLSCHQWGYLYAAKYGTVLEFGYSTASEHDKVSILLSCPGTALHIEQCPYSMTEECDSAEHVAIVCANSKNERVTTTNQETYYSTIGANDTKVTNVEKSFVRVSVALGFGLLAVLMAGIVLVSFSIAMWRKKGNLQTESELLGDDYLNMDINRDANIYLPPPKYSQINII